MEKYFNLNTPVMYWQNHVASLKGKLTQMPIIEILNKIKNNNSFLFIKAREIFENEGKSDKYIFQKRKIHSCHFNLSFCQNRELVKNEKIVISNLMYIDFDFDLKKQDSNIRKLKIKEIKNEICELPFVLSCWISTSGQGLSLIINLNFINQNNFKNKFKLIKLFFFEKFKIKLDQKCSNLNRACFINYDPAIYINEKCVELSENTITDFLESKGVRYVDSYIHKQPDTPFNRTPRISSHYKDCYFEKSHPEIHFPDILKQINLDGKNNWIDHDGHYFFQLGFPFVKLPYRKQILLGTRNNTLHLDLATFIFLNPHLTYDGTRFWLHNYNEKKCIPPLDDSEVDRILNNVLEYKKEDKLRPNIKIKKNHWALNSKSMSKNKKLKIVAKCKRTTTLNKIEFGIRTLVDKCELVNNSKLHRLTKIRRATIIDNVNYYDIEFINSYLTDFKNENGNLPEDSMLVEMAPEHPDSLYFRQSLF